MLVGNRATPALSGGAGNDVLWIADGTATGAGSDRFVIDRGTVARITDFDPSSDHLVLDLAKAGVRALRFAADAEGLRVIARDGTSILLEGLSQADVSAVRRRSTGTTGGRALTSPISMAKPW